MRISIVDRASPIRNPQSAIIRNPAIRSPQLIRNPQSEIRNTIDHGGPAIDLYTIWYHGSTITHVDALCHYSYEGKVYNGFDRSKIAQGPGCVQNGVEHQKDGIMTRGILVDMPRMRNVPYLEPGTPVYPSDLEAWEKFAGIGDDAVNDVQPLGIEGNQRPIHQLAIVALGLPLVDVMDLEAVAETAARLKRWEFLLTAAPIPVPGGTGFPLNPIATF